MKQPMAHPWHRLASLDRSGERRALGAAIESASDGGPIGVTAFDLRDVVAFDHPALTDPQRGAYYGLGIYVTIDPFTGKNRW